MQTTTVAAGGPVRNGVAPARVRARRPRLGREDRRWVTLLVVVPLLAFAVPALLGHPVLLGDDLTQNEPLRVLVGRQLRAGELPLFDPYLWSGTPLLGGWNAGAAYPLTWLFAVLPATAAWTAGLVVTWWTAGVSLYALLRDGRLVPTAAGVGALGFAFSGAFLAQVVHFGLVAGMSWVPLEVLAVGRIASASKGRVRAGWAVVLAVSWALTVLAGEPRAIDDAAVVVACVAAWRLGRLGRQGVGPLGAVVVGVVVGTGLAAVQWLPGLEAVAGSQRSAGSLSLFASGSLPDRWLSLLLVPDLLGGSGSFRQPAFLGGYNLTEVAGYVGALPVVGALALLGTLRRRRPVPAWLVWHVVAVLGVVLALGINTPLGHLLARVPLYGGQRLQSRNILVADLALAVLGGYAVDHLLAPGDRRTGEKGLGERRPAALAVLGAGLLVAPVVVLAAWGNGFLRALRVGSPAPGAAGAVLPATVPFAVLGLAAGAVVAAGRRLGPRVRRRAVVGLVGTNLVAFAVLVVVAVPPASAPGALLGRPAATARRAAPRPSAPRPAALAPGPVRPVGALGLGGRFAVYDPDLLDGAGLTALGVPDGNVVSGAPSVLGYGSIVSGRYAAATGAHAATGQGQDVFAPAAAADGVLDALGTRALVTLPAYLLTPAGAGGPAPGEGTGVRRVLRGRPASWFFGEPLAVSSLAVPRAGPAGGRARLGLLLAGGRTRWVAGTDGRGGLVARLARPVVAVGVVAEAPAGSLLGPPRLSSGGATLVADGQLAGVVVPPRWRFVGRDGPFSVFADRFAAPALRLVALPGRRLGPALLSDAQGPAAAPTAVRVRAPHGALLVRSVSALAGWRASWQPEGTTAAVPLVVRRRGLVQAVAVPAGAGEVRFVYEPPGLVPGAAVALAALVALAVLLARARRRPRPSGEGTVAPGARPGR